MIMQVGIKSIMVSTLICHSNANTHAYTGTDLNVYIRRDYGTQLHASGAHVHAHTCACIHIDYTDTYAHPSYTQVRASS